MTKEKVDKLGFIKIRKFYVSKDTIKKVKCTEDFQGSGNTLYNTIMMDTCHYTFVQTHRMYNLNINYGHGVIVMYQRSRVINSSKCSTPVSGVDNGETVHVWGQAVYGESLPSSQFCSEPKTALKKTVLKRKTTTHRMGGNICKSCI